MQYVTLNEHGKITASANWPFSGSTPAKEEVVRNEEGQFVYKSQLDVVYEESIRQKRKEVEIKAKRNALLEATDKYLLPDFPISEEEKAQYKMYRHYLRDYPSNPNWYLMEPKTFDDFINRKNT